jgi:hypothetical protein
LFLARFLKVISSKQPETCAAMRTDIFNYPEKCPRDKLSSLFCHGISDEEKIY